MTGASPQLESLADRVMESAGRQRLVLLATERRWLATALEEVLAPEGFELARAADADELLDLADHRPPAIVVVDEELPGLDISATARSLIDDSIGRRTPLLLYTSSSVARGERHAEAYRAGYWDLLSEPLRPSVFVARLRRLLAMSEDMKESAGAAERQQPSTVGFLTLDELGRVLPAMGALAEREDATVSLVLLAPGVGDGTDRKRQKSAAASLCGPHLRQADLCAWIDDAELAVVAFDTDASDARSLVERLDGLADDRPGLAGTAGRLSAAIVELEPSGELERAVERAGRRGEDETVSLDEIVELFHLTDARDALREARRAGGGVRVVEFA